MNDKNTALNEVEEPTIDTTPVSEEVPEETVETPVESTEETKEETVETEEEPKKGAAQRIRELDEKAKTAVAEADAAKAESKSLADKLAELTGSVEPSGQVPQYVPQVEPGSEVSTEQYQQDVLRSADALVTLKIKQSEAVNRINNEAQDVIRKYPELDPKSDSFNKELSDTITEATDAYVSKSPYTASVSKFVEKLMKPYKGSVAKEVGEATETIAKQVSEAALRPTSIRKSEKAASEKSIAELEQELGVVQS